MKIDEPAIFVLSAKNEKRLKIYAVKMKNFFTSSFNIADIAFTSQVGREAMEERLAVIVNSVEDLKKKLESFIAGEDNIEDFYRGSVKRNKDTLAVFEADEDLQKATDAWIAKGKYPKLLSLWVKGLIFDWNKLYGENKPKRVSLPTYPFAKEHYWIEEKDENSRINNKSSKILHPFLHENTSDLTEQRFSSTFTGDEFFLTDHVVQRRKVLPGVAYLEMARAAIEQAAKVSGATGITLKNVVWARPIVVKDDPVDVHIGLFPEQNGEIAYEIYTRSDSKSGKEDTEPLVHSQATVLLNTAGKVPVLDIESLKAECRQKVLNTDEYYEDFAKAGLEYGAGHRGIKKIYAGDGKVLAKLALPASLSDTADQFVLHPTLTDSALQVSTGLTTASGKPEPALPSALERLEIFGGCTSFIWAYIRYGKGRSAGDNVRKFDIDLCDEQGKVCARMKGMELREHKEISTEFPKNVIPFRYAEPSELMTFEEYWQEEELHPASDIEIKTLVCFLAKPETGEIVAKTVKRLAPETETIFIFQSDRYKKEAQNYYSVSKTDRKTYEKAFAGIIEDYGPIDAVLYMPALEDSKSASDYSGIVHIIQAVAAVKLKSLRFLPAVRLHKGEERCYPESWIGFERSLGLVMPNMQFGVIYRETETSAEISTEDWVEILWQELQTDKIESVLYKENKRHVYRIAKTKPENNKSIIKQGGTYLITGGCGGLGVMFADYLAKKYSANLILTGRSQIDDKKRSVLKSIENSGGRVKYIQADICDFNSMKKGLTDAKEHFGKTDGVIHAAGIESDQSILEKNMEGFSQVLRPKVEGTLVSDKILDGQSCDFICYFSSSSAILGDFGACDYAIGNRFQMAYATHKNKVGKNEPETKEKHIVINWPLWKEGGMGFKSDDSTKMYLKSSGQRFLETEEGLELFDRLLSQKNRQHLVLAGEPSRIKNFLGLSKSESLPSAQHPVISASFGKGRRKEMKGFTIAECLEYDLKDHISKLLTISPAQLDSDVNLADFGFDSITLTELASVLTQFYEIEITPSIFFGHSTIEELVRYFLEKHNGVVEIFYEESGTETFQPQTVSEPKVVPELIRRNKPRFLSSKAVSAILEPIAIIGMSGRFPGARNIDEMWQILAEGREAVTEIPIERFDWRKYCGESEKMISNRCGILPGVDEFDPLFFEISPREAEEMDPRQRLLLQESWKALEDAGYGPSHIEKNKMGIFVGVESGDYQLLSNNRKGITSDHEGILAVRLAYFLNFRGPAMAINTACSSGLVAAHQACQSLRNRECDTAIAAGVNLILSPEAYIAMGGSGMLSPSGRCFAFDKRADGMVPGEAVVSVVLKRLSDARKERDSIYAVIKGSTINYDGKTNGITVPNGNAQTELIKSVYDQFQINPEKTDYIVTHGTGTKLGDPVEINALNDAFTDYTNKSGYCALTSSKTNFGHTFAASGLLSLVNLVQALRHKTIPASLNCEEENDYINWKESPFYVNKSVKPWKAGDGVKRIGAVSAFGMSGTNAHMVVEGYDENKIETDSPSDHFYLLIFSAKSRDALEEKIVDMLSFLQHKNVKKKDLSRISLTLSEGCHHFMYRNAIVIQDIEDAIYVLAQLKNKEKSPKIFFGKSHRDFTGQNAIRRYVKDMLNQADSVRSDKNKYRELLYGLAELYCQGYEIKLSRLYGKDKLSGIHLPTYPFTKKRYWIQDTEIVSKPAVSAAKSSTNYASSNIEQITEIKELPDAMADYLIKEISAFLKVEPQDMDPDDDFEAYGLDSILITGLTNELEEQFGKLPATLFYTYKNIESLARYFVEEHKENTVSMLSMKHDAPSPQKPENELVSVSRKATPKHISDYLQHTDIAVTGLAGKYPMAKNAEEYWENLKAGKDCVTEVPKERWDCDNYPDMYCRWGGFLDDIDKFDPLFFNISPNSAKIMDPQERLFLETVWECLEDAGYTKKRLEDPSAGDKRGNIGVFAGVSFNEYQLYSIAQWSEGNFIPGNSQICSVANRISYFLNLRGPSLSVDTACSSSLYAIHLACDSILHGECEAAIAGGVNLSVHPNKYLGLCSIDMLSRKGRCDAFGEGADGMVSGEAVGAIFLKPLNRAIEDRDRIYAVIKGTAVNHDGKTHGYTVPNPVAQTELIKSVIDKSGVDPAAISYVEAHGTGTSLGDPIEIGGLTDAYRCYTDNRQYCAIGSVKSNIGHSEAAAGIAQLTKIILQMKYKTLLPSLIHSEHLNPKIDFENSPFFVQQKLEEWKQPIITKNGQRKVFPRLAGMSSFGATGVNAHLIVEEYDSGDKIIPIEELEKKIKEFPVEAGYHQVIYDRFENWCCNLLLTTFQSMGLFKTGEESWSETALKEKIKLSDAHEQILDVFLEILSESGFIKISDDNINCTSEIDNFDIMERVKNERERLEKENPELKPIINLLNICAENYSEILSGRILPTAVMFPNSSMKLVEGVYNQADSLNHLVAESVKTYVSELLDDSAIRNKLKILEIGAGTGGTTGYILEAVKDYKDNIHYEYTDLSKGFLIQGEEKFGKNYDCIRFNVLDIGKNIIEQGYNFKEFDMAIAVNVLHATRRMDTTLYNVKSLLKTGGVLVLKEATQKSTAASMTFGLLEGWWLFKDPENRLSGSPIISFEKWHDILKSQGFEKILSRTGNNLSEHLIIAQSDGIITKDDEKRKIFILSAKNKERLQAYSLNLIDFLEKRESVSLSDIAYTLQCGREAMEYRLAITADNREALVSGLKDYCENIKNKNLYFGNIDKKQKSGHRDEQNLIENTIKEKRLSELARLWVSGSDIEWRLLYTYLPNVISLPTYPFAKERYWIVESSKEQTDVSEEKKSEVVIEQSEPAVLSESLPFLRELIDSPEFERKELLEKYLQKILADILGFDPPKMPVLSEGFFEMGMESVAAVRFQTEIEKDFGMKISDTAMFDYPNILDLSEYLIGIIPFEELEDTETRNKGNFDEGNLGKEFKTYLLEEPLQEDILKMSIEEIKERLQHECQVE